MIKLLTFTALLTVFLTACGGGSDDKNSNAPIVSVADYPEEKLISGQSYQLSNEDFEVFQDYYCDDSDLSGVVYETDNVIVAGAPSDSEKSLQMVATFAEEELESVASVFGLTVSDFFSYRTHFSDEAFRYVNSSREEEITYQEWLSLTKEEKEFYLSEAVAHQNDDPLTYMQRHNIHEEHEKAVICLGWLHAGYATGRGKPYGMWLLDPDFVPDYYKENDYSLYKHIIEHEFVHFAQFVIPANNENMAIPVWLAEGMAEYLTDGKIAETVRGVGTDVMVRPPDFQFDHYDEAALIVRYIVEDLGNGKESLFNMLLNMRNRATDQAEYSENEYLMDDIFKETFVDYDGSQLGYFELREEYWSRLP